MRTRQEVMEARRRRYCAFLEADREWAKEHDRNPDGPRARRLWDKRGKLWKAVVKDIRRSGGYWQAPKCPK